MEHKFTLTVSGTEDGEWQGLVAEPGGQSADFQSILELLRVMEKMIGEEG